MTAQDEAHDRTRAYPTQEQAALRSILEKAGVPIVGYEFKVLDGDNALWFDAAILLGRELALVDLRDWRKTERNDVKRAYCEREGIPLLQVTQGKAIEMLFELEKWLLTRRDSPVAEGDNGQV